MTTSHKAVEVRQGHIWCRCQNNIDHSVANANWIIGLYDYLRNNSDCIKSSFEQAGINEALLIDLEPEDPFYDLE